MLSRFAECSGLLLKEFGSLTYYFPAYRLQRKSRPHVLDVRNILAKAINTREEQTAKAGNEPEQTL